MIRDYLTQTAILKSVIGYNGYGEAQYSEKEINCRIERKRKLVLNKEGKEEVCDTTLYCIEPVSPNDKVKIGDKEYIVIDVQEIADWDGNALYYEVLLK